LQDQGAAIIIPLPAGLRVRIDGQGIESKMATLNRIEIKKRRKKRARLKKKLRCRFCPDGCNHSPRPIYVDFKDLKTLRLMIDREGHIQSRRRTGNCAKYQRAVRRAVLRARFMGLLPYVSEE
jgi:small subunit ribosomal protein S18